MKTRKGFTLIELIVSMGVTVIILAAIVGFIRGGFISMLSGQSQATAYAKARAVMNDIKDTLKYADPTSIEFTAGSRLYYESATSDTEASVEGSDPTGSKYSYTSREITWDTSTTPPRLKIVKDGDTANPVYYPDKDGSSNNAFSSSEYLKAYGDFSGTTVTSAQFPVFADPDDVNTSGKATLYDIILPVKYSSMAINTKVDILRTKVNTDQKSFEKKVTAEDTTALDIAIILKDYSATLYNSKDFALQNSKKKYVSQVSSSGRFSNNVAGVTTKFMNYMKANNSEAYQTLLKRAWVIVALNADGLLGQSGSNTVDHWGILVAKNAEDDAPTAQGVTLYGTNDNTANANEYKRLAEDEGKYVIRPKFGMRTYFYETIKQTGVFKNPSEGDALGYASCYFDTSTKSSYINFYTWVKDYKQLRYSNNGSTNSADKVDGLYIEDQSATQNGTHKRIDYDGDGAEYTRATEGTTYSYWPAMATTLN